MKKKGRTETDHQASVLELNLPEEIVEEILTWLPAKHLIRFRSVCKHFRTLLTKNPSFIEKQLTRTSASSYQTQTYNFILQSKGSDDDFYYIPNGSFKKVRKLDTWYIVKDPCMVGSSNGLICLAHGHSFNRCFAISLWNPATRECKTLPQPQIMRRRRSDKAILGFGFHPTINDYKVVRLVPFEELHNVRRTLHIEAEVYSLSTNSWRRVGEFPYYVSHKSCNTAVLNGAVHWVGSANEGALLGEYTWYYCELILCFDIADEVFRVIQVPENIYQRPLLWDVHLRMFRGLLSMFVTDSTRIDLWVMNEYGVRESWTKLFKVEPDQVRHRPLAFLENGEILLQTTSCELASYNSRSRKTRILQFEDTVRIDVVPYVESLVQLTIQN